MFELKFDRPQWQIIYDRLVTMKIGEVVKYDELCGLLEADDRQAVRVPLYRAVKQMEDDHKRTFEVVRNVGYRMVEAAEHERLSRSQHKAAKRRISAAIRKAVSADPALLTPEQKRSINALADHLASMQSFIRRLDGQIKTETRERKAETANLSDRVDRLASLLERHGIRDEQTAEAA